MTDGCSFWSSGSHLCCSSRLWSCLLAECVNLDESVLRKQRAKSVNDVKRTNGQLRLEQKLREVLGSANIDESRILTEAAIFADKVAVDEETVRLRSHVSQLRGLAAGDSPAGRKMDFLIQELNREANTIGSKCQNADIAHVVVDLKAEIEKIREQIQNVE